MSGYSEIRPDGVSGEALTLRLRQVAQRMEVTDLWLYKANLGREEVVDRLIYTLTAYVLSDHLATDQTVVFSNPQPTSWWQHTKAVHFPTLSRWLRRPPRFEREKAVVEIESFATFPQAKVPYPEGLGPMRIVQFPSISVYQP